MLKAHDVALGCRQLAGFDAARAGHGDPLAQQGCAGGGNRVSLVEHLAGERLLADLERSQADGLSGRLTARYPDRPNDLDVLLLNPLGELQTLEQILEPA